ncbi:MAG: exodeoxyribonuclease VII small subunit [bacterium]|nr:exodeoxyribonuclease VII small subunit [bacterium]
MAAKFEENLKQLEAIVESLEEGPADLDEALKSFERGIKLSRACHKELAEAEKRVEVLLKDESGQLSKERLED